MTGFEPATSCSQSRRATKLRYIPVVKHIHYHNTAERQMGKFCSGFCKGSLVGIPKHTFYALWVRSKTYTPIKIHNMWIGK